MKNRQSTPVLKLINPYVTLTLSEDDILSVFSSVGFRIKSSDTVLYRPSNKGSYINVRGSKSKIYLNDELFDIYSPLANMTFEIGKAVKIHDCISLQRVDSSDYRIYFDQNGLGVYYTFNKKKLTKEHLYMEPLFYNSIPSVHGLFKFREKYAAKRMYYRNLPDVVKDNINSRYISDDINVEYYFVKLKDLNCLSLRFDNSTKAMPLDSLFGFNKLLDSRTLVISSNIDIKIYAMCRGNVLLPTDDIIIQFKYVNTDNLVNRYLTINKYLDK